jgi:hypothetical protein
MNKAVAPSTKWGRILNICLKLKFWSKAKINHLKINLV